MESCRKKTRGHNLQIGLAGDLSAEKLLPLSCEKGVSYVPGSSFFMRRADGERYMHLNFATQPPELIDDGIKRLGRAIRRLAALPDPAQRT